MALTTSCSCSTSVRFKNKALYIVMLKSLIFVLASLSTVAGYSNGATSCVTVGHGTFKTPLPTDWTLSLHDGAGNSVTTWTAGQTYTAQISGTTTFKGWQWGPLKGTPASFTAGSSSMAGSFAAGDSLSHSVTGCAGSITQTSASSHTTIKALWTPPAAGTGTVSLWSVMVISKNGNNYNAVLTVNEAPAGTLSSSPAAAASSTHTVTATETASHGASETETGTRTESLSATASPSVQSSPVGAVAVNTAASSGSGSGVTVVTSGANAYNLLAVGLGCTFGGAIAVALVVLALRRSQPKKILHHTPTVIRVSPLQEAGPNPYV